MAFRNRRIVNASGAAHADRVRSKVTRIGILLIATVFVVGFMAASIYDRFGSLTISAGSNDSDKKYSLTLYELSDLSASAATISAKTIPQITNISEATINNVSNIENISSQTYGGQHNGENYFAYTFFLQNNGDETFNYNYSMRIVDSTKGLERGIRVRIYRALEKDGPSEYKTYAMDGPDIKDFNPMTIEFSNAETVAIDRVNNFAKNDVHRYTVVIWIEGNDMDTDDSMIGGSIKFDMKFEISTESMQETD